MKQFYTLTVLVCLLTTLLFSCQKELYFPEPEPTSKFTVVIDGVTYDLQVGEQTTHLSDTAHVNITAISPMATVRLIAKTDKHESGVGDYFLWCCSNDVFERTTGTQIHYEIRRSGRGKQDGQVKITKMNNKGYEGTYSLNGKQTNGTVKQFTGEFSIVY